MPNSTDKKMANLSRQICTAQNEGRDEDAARLIRKLNKLTLEARLDKFRGLSGKA